eukprot:CAMPEP_0202025920 /NCGR_PEP_ID=MMETSP0905-20130828/57612_1 /ASSEMBLY_ACC=CAM_ASM_000554 /TAXON_ID=420261 /ORGANISM="Thalassiosira antarctica, Strain CCMP982" /LENGTH=50 /DNA_ID=CAMNT_0048588975 /DNA_START=22 /DNA_END=170 /DNA_ORIENTATION=+
MIRILEMSGPSSVGLMVGCLLRREACAWCCGLEPIPTLMERILSDQEAAA